MTLKTTKNEAHKRRMREANSMIILPLIHIFIFCYLPMFGVIIAFKDYRYARGIFGSKWVGLKNFEIFWKSNDIWKIVGNTIWLNLSFMFLLIIAGVILAVLLFELKNSTALKVYHTTMITPHFVSWVIGGYVVYALLSPETGAINGILKGLGIAPVQWYAEARLWPGILAIANTWKHVGMRSILYYAALMGVDPTLFEAAEMDGANKIQKIWYISIPSIKSLIIMMSILALGGIFSADFGLFYSVPMNSGLLYETTDVIDTYIFRALKEVGDVGMSSAVGLFQSVVGFVTVVTTNTIVNKIDSDSALF